MTLFSFCPARYIDFITSALLGNCEESGACLVGDSEPLHLESLLCAVLYLH